LGVDGDDMQYGDVGEDDLKGRKGGKSAAISSKILN